MNEKSKKKKTFRFLKDKWFYISLIIMALIVVVAFEMTFMYLDKFTRHGDEIEVPDLMGQNFVETVEKFDGVFTFILLDSVYVKDFPEGAVFQQNPEPGSKVKQGRNVYVVCTSISPELVAMPNLRNLSLRQAMVHLEQVGLKTEKLEFINYFARNAVVEQRVKDVVVEPNEEVVKGTGITLVVGLGNGDKNTNLPDLIGVNKAEVKYRINNASLNIGMEITPVEYDGDDENYFVSRMTPEYSADKMVPLGSFVDVWYQSDKNFDFAWYNAERARRDSTVEAMRLRRFNADTIQYVLDSFNFILRNRTFSFDSLQRELDKKMLFKASVNEFEEFEFDFDDLENVDYNNDYKIDTSFFYYE